MQSCPLPQTSSYLLQAKLEQNLDELEDSVERERKVRSETEKLKKKAEMDLRMTQVWILID